MPWCPEQGQKCQAAMRGQVHPQANQSHQCCLSAPHRNQPPKLVAIALVYPHSVLPLCGVTPCTKGQVLSRTKHCSCSGEAQVTLHRVPHTVLCWGFSLLSRNLPPSCCWSSEACSRVRTFKKSPTAEKNSGALRLPFSVKIPNNLLLWWSRKVRYMQKTPRAFHRWVSYGLSLHCL